jgi:hypothetical protein
MLLPGAFDCLNSSKFGTPSEGRLGLILVNLHFWQSEAKKGQKRVLDIWDGKHFLGAFQFLRNPQLIAALQHYIFGWMMQPETRCLFQPRPACLILKDVNAAGGHSQCVCILCQEACSCRPRMLPVVDVPPTCSLALFLLRRSMLFVCELQIRPPSLQREHQRGRNWWRQRLRWTFRAARTIPMQKIIRLAFVVDHPLGAPRFYILLNLEEEECPWEAKKLVYFSQLSSAIEGDLAWWNETSPSSFALPSVLRIGSHTFLSKKRDESQVLSYKVQHSDQFPKAYTHILYLNMPVQGWSARLGSRRSPWKT